MGRERPFDIPAAVVLPDHVHFLWTLPEGDTDYPTRVGRTKAVFTRSLAADDPRRMAPTVSRDVHRESGVWQRRYWEHTIRDEDDFKAHLDYVHYNPVRHGYVRSAREWSYSSFSRWVARGEYDSDWGAGPVDADRMDRIATEAGE